MFTVRPTANDVADDEDEDHSGSLEAVLIVVRQSLSPGESIATALVHQMLRFIVSSNFEVKLSFPFLISNEGNETTFAWKPSVNRITGASPKKSEI